MGITLNFTKAFHPQTNRQSERVIQILEDPLQHVKVNWIHTCP